MAKMEESETAATKDPKIIRGPGSLTLLKELEALIDYSRPLSFSY